MRSNKEALALSDIPNRPNLLCPKCGWMYGFLHSKPTFHKTHPAGKHWGDYHPVGEHLDWECQVCGFVIHTPTLQVAIRETVR